MENVEEVRTYEDFLSLEEEWNGLLERSSNDSVFLRHEWFRCWWEAYGKGSELLVLLVRSEGRLTGIAPFMRRRRKMRGLTTAEVTFMENGESPRCGIICPDLQGSTLASLVHHLLTSGLSWDVLFLDRTCREGRLHEAVARVCRAEGIRTFCRPSWKSPCLTVEGDWESFYQARSTKFRKRQRSILNRIRRLGEISLEETTELSEAETALLQAFDVGSVSWKKEAGRAISSTEETRRFFTLLTKTAAERGWLTLWLLKLNGKAIAFEYQLRYKGRVHGMRSEFDQACESASPGAVLDRLTIEQLFRGGVTEYDMGGTANEYKTHWTSRLREHVTTFVFNKTPRGRFFALLEGGAIARLKAARDSLRNMGSARRRGGRRTP